MNKKWPVTDSVFHVQNRNEDGVISDVILKEARKTGKLTLPNLHLVTWPEEIFKLSVVHSDSNEIDFAGKKNDDYKWWEVEPLKYLDLSSNTLTLIPADIKELDSLMTLLLQQNLIQAIPSELGHLKSLVNLDLAHNKICEVPPAFDQLKELRTLNLSNNLFKVFPEPVYDLVLLNKLDISKNIIEEMGPGVGFLTRLTSLNLSQNKLSSVPSDLTNCRALKELNLSNNKILSKGLPDLIDMNVEVLQLHYNQLTCLPKLRGCSNLKEIHLGFNKIEEITVEELSTLSHLLIINLRNNQLKTIPKELSCLQNLIRLDLSYNNLKELPATLSLLPHLNSLLVEGNELRTIRRDILQGGTTRLLAHLKKSLDSETETNCNNPFSSVNESDLPDRFAMRCSRAVNLSSKGFSSIPNVVFEEAVAVPCNIVDLSKNKLQNVPEGVWLLSKYLNDLNLSQNPIKEIPMEIGKCLNLRYLNISNNQLKSLPNELSQCNRLKEINVSFNRLEEIPACVYELHALEILNISNNKVEVVNAEKFLGLKYLTHLDLCNNNLRNVPPLMGKMTQLRSFGLDGNGLKALRPATLAKGTDAVLAWLRDKIV